MDLLRTISTTFASFWQAATEGALAAPIWNAVFWISLLFLRRHVLTGLARFLGISDASLRQTVGRHNDLAFVILLLILAVVPFFDALELPGHAVVASVGRILSVGLALYIGIHSVDLAVFHWFLGQKRNVTVPAVMRLFVLGILYAVALLLLLDWGFKLNVLPLLATSTVVTAALGLSLQDTLRNMFAGLTLTLENNFREGDWIMFRLDASNTWVGKIEEIGWRSTRIRTPNSTYAIIPNAHITSNYLINFSGSALPNEQARTLSFPIDIKAGGQQVRDVLRTAALAVPGVLEQPPPAVAALEVRGDQVVYQLRFWAPSFEKAEELSSEVLESALEELVRIDVLPRK